MFLDKGLCLTLGREIKSRWNIAQIAVPVLRNLDFHGKKFKKMRGAHSYVTYYILSNVCWFITPMNTIPMDPAIPSQDVRLGYDD